MTVTLERGGVLRDGVTQRDDHGKAKEGVVLGRVLMTTVNIKARARSEPSPKGRAVIRKEPGDFEGPVRLDMRKPLTASQMAEVSAIVSDENAVRDHLLKTMCVQDTPEDE